MSTKITYNGKTTELADGYIATLPCKDLKMETDVVIEAPEPAEISDSSLPIEVSTEAEMTALLTSGEVGGVYKYTGTTGTYENGALYVLEEETASITINGWGNVAGWEVSISNVTSSTTWADVASNNSYYQVVNTSQSTGNGSAVILVDANNTNIVKLDYSGGGGYYPVYKGVNAEGGAVYGSDLVLSQSVYYAGAESVGGGGAN